MDRTQQVNWLNELAGNIASNLHITVGNPVQCVHDEIASYGTESRYVGHGLDMETGEYDVDECLAYDLVEYALSELGRESWSIEIPEWFEAHDRVLLERFVSESL